MMEAVHFFPIGKNLASEQCFFNFRCPVLIIWFAAIFKACGMEGSSVQRPYGWAQPLYLSLGIMDYPGFWRRYTYSGVQDVAAWEAFLGYLSVGVLVGVAVEASRNRH